MNKFCTSFAPPPKVVSPSGDVSLVDSSGVKDCDINTIVRRYNAGDSSVIRKTAYFGDVSELGDFAHALEVVNKARGDFEALPSAIRSQFGNDPVALIEWLKDSSHDDEAVRLGLKVRKVAEKPLEQKIVDGVTSALKQQAEAKTATNV